MTYRLWRWLVMHEVRVFGRPVVSRRKLAVWMLYRQHRIELWKRFHKQLDDTVDAVNRWLASIEQKA